jgi:hypothetical protein
LAARGYQPRARRRREDTGFIDISSMRPPAPAPTLTFARKPLR